MFLLLFFFFTCKAAYWMRISDWIQTFALPIFLVNNAASRRQGPFTEMSYGEWREIMAVILDGAFLMCRAVLPVMVAGGGGTIVNIGGVSAHIGAKNRAHVSAAKAGIVGLTKALAVEFADRKVTVNCLAPGKIGGERSASAGASPKMSAEIPLGREGEIEEDGGLVVGLVLPAAGVLNGQARQEGGRR